MARVFMKGTEAIAEAAVRAGCRFFAGYPITPQNEIPEYLARRLPEVEGRTELPLLPLTPRMTVPETGLDEG